MPGHCLGNAPAQAMRRGVAQQAARLPYVSPAVAHIANTKVTIHGLDLPQVRVNPLQNTVKLGAEFIERRLFARRHVVDLIDRPRIVSRGGQQIRLDCVVDVTEIATGLPVAIYKDLFALEHGSGPFRYHSSVFALGILPWPEHIEIAQTDRGKAVATGEDSGVEFVHIFGHAVRAELLAHNLFNLGQARVVTVSAAASGVREAFDLRAAGGHQHIQETRDVGGVGFEWVSDAARHTGERCLMQDVVDAFAGLAAIIKAADITLCETELRPLVAPHYSSDFVEIASMSRSKIV